MEKKTLIIGGTKGIGQALVEQLNGHDCYSISRSASNRPNHFVLDVLNDDLPEIEGLTGLVYCPGSINLKPFHRLSREDFLADFEKNVLGAVRALQFYFRTLKKK